MIVLLFLDALASLDFKLSVSEWVTFLLLAHLRVFQIIFNDNTSSSQAQIQRQRLLRLLKLRLHQPL